MSSQPSSSYLRAWLSNPFKFGAVAPSGPALATLITREITPHSAPVIELGAGTGALTRALLDRGVSESDLVLIEQRADFADELKRRFPLASVHSVDAEQMDQLAYIFPERKAGAVISGLPFLTIPDTKVAKILASAFLLLRDDGAFYQFTYAPRCPISRSIMLRLGLRSQRMGGALLNIPPASVYRFTRTPARTDGFS